MVFVLLHPSYVRIAARRADAIVHGGRTTYPRELEDLLRPHPAVPDAGNVAIPTETLGERICACVVATEGSIVTGDELKDSAARPSPTTQCPTWN